MFLNLQLSGFANDDVFREQAAGPGGDNDIALLNAAVLIQIRKLTLVLPGKIDRTGYDPNLTASLFDCPNLQLRA